MPSSDRSLVRRVGATAAVAAAAASIATLVVTFGVVDLEVGRDAEADALARAEAVARALDAEATDGPVTTEVVEEEVVELGHGPASLAVWGPEGHIAGDDAMPASASDGCSTLTSQDGAWLVCRATCERAGYWALVGEPRAQIFAYRASLLLGGVVALLVVVLGAIGAGFGVGRWSLRPLVELQGALAHVDAASPADSVALPRSGMREVDGFAEAITALLSRLDVELLRSRRFAADAAHELRTPLTKLRTELELLAEDHEAGALEGVALGRAVARVEELGRLVDHLLLLASPGVALRGDGLVSVAALAETAVESLEPAESARVSLDLEDDGTVCGDATVLAAVVTNALGNALKFSTGPVALRVAATSEHVVLRIDDEGPGLDDAARERAFEPFFRAADQRGAPGHGIGLALIAHVVDAHAGEVAFVDETPGAHLEIRLPRHRV